ncbi:DUF6281 family protein [Streptomyces sp. NPDC000983]|uniref:DUF6281 family protein n=1 Tax=Streptomyces sp. NPDC000983 TaxID=3154373 RepID=UPI003316BE52
MRAVLLPAVVTAVVWGATGCQASADGPDAGEGAASCAYVVDYDGRRYTDTANIDYERGAELGTATQPPCDDTPGDGDDGGPAHRTTAYRVEGVDPEVAITVGDAPDGVLLVAARPDGELPPEVARLPRLTPQPE